MSRLYSASQFDSAYNPRKLGNWEATDKSKERKPASGKGAGRTVPLVDARGHLVGAKRLTAFTEPKVWTHPPARWPQPNPTIKGTSAATMGFKSIQTAFLPSSAVKVHTVEIPGCKERNFAATLH